MKTCIKCLVEKSLSEFYKQRDGLHACCKSCLSARTVEWRKANSERRKATDKERYKLSPEKTRASNRKWASANPDKLRLAISAWQKRHPENGRAAARKWRDSNVEKARAKYVAWAKLNKDLRAACKASRKARKLDATPKWADQGAIRKFFLEAQEKTKSTGQPWQVDHIVPLQSKLVCGLHVEQNLRVISASENSSKKNYYWPNMP